MGYYGNVSQLHSKADANRPVSYDDGAYGLVGVAIAAIIAGPLERSIRQSRLYRCMVPRGYARYRTSEDAWKLLNSGREASRAIMLKRGSPPARHRPRRRWRHERVSAALAAARARVVRRAVRGARRLFAAALRPRRAGGRDVTEETLN